VSNLEYLNFVINGKYSKKNYNNPKYYASFIIFQTSKNVILKNVHSLGCFLWLYFYLIFNQITRLRKGLLSYFKSNGMTIFKKHVNANHELIAKKLRKKWITTWKVQWKNNNNKKGMQQVGISSPIFLWP
jgi:hypothetical protein